MLFSMLANLAEDRQGAAVEPGADVAQAIARWRRRAYPRSRVLELLGHALSSRC